MRRLIDDVGDKILCDEYPYLLVRGHNCVHGVPLSMAVGGMYGHATNEIMNISEENTMDHIWLDWL